MWKPNPLLLLLVISLFVSASAASGGKPLVTSVTKDASTSLYTAPLKHGRPLVLDLSSPVISVTCPSKKQQQAGTPTTTTLSANATDGRTPLFPISFSASASCAPPPAAAAAAGAVGVAGLAPSAQSLPAQVARTQNVANKLALCLPSDGKTTSGDGVGVAILGGGPFFFIPPDRGDFTAMLDGTARLHEHSGSSPGYYISGTGIAIQQARVPLPGSSSSGKLVIALSSTAPYTALRPDVYGPVVEAFDRAASGPEFPFMSWAAAVAPFERCYDSTKLPQSKLGYFVPQIDLELEGGGTFSVLGGNSMVQVNAGTACLGFVRMKVAGGGGGGAPAAMILGGFQLENRLLVFDVEKGQLGFTTFLNAIGLSCSNFNFTLAA